MKISVTADALRQVLVALNGPMHHIGELRATRGPGFEDNPIDTLIREYNAALEAVKETAATDEGGAA